MVDPTHLVHQRRGPGRDLPVPLEPAATPEPHEPRTGVSLTRRISLLAPLALTGCFGGDEPGNTDAEGTGALLSTDYYGDTDVIGFNFTVERVDCGDGAAFEPYDWEVTAFDLGYEGGNQVRIEDIVSPELSRDEFVFPIYTNWIEEPMGFDETGSLVNAHDVDIERAPGCSYTDAETFYCNAGNVYGVDPDVRAYLCDGTDLIEEALYPECPAS